MNICSRLRRQPLPALTALLVSIFGGCRWRDVKSILWSWKGCLINSVYTCLQKKIAFLL
jgi:hypothetical protein